MPFSLYLKSDSMRRHEYGVATVGVSGVLHKPDFRKLARQNSVVRAAELAARKTNALAGSEGNLFAGSLDSSLGARIVLGLYDNEVLNIAEGVGSLSFAEMAVEDIAKRHAIGINVH